MPLHTRMRTGPRCQIWPSVAGYKTASPSATIVGHPRHAPVSGPDSSCFPLTVGVGKKIKERMADLERMAGGREGVKGNSNGKKLPKIKKPTRRHTTPPPEATTDSFQAPQQHGVPPFTPPMNPEDQPFFPSPSPPAPSSPAYSTYQQAYSPPQSDSGLLMPLFGSSQPQPTSASYQFGMVSTAAVPTLPPMTHFSDAYKGGNESMSSFPSYGDYSLGVNPSHYDSNPHVSSSRHAAPGSFIPPFGGIATTGHLAAPLPYKGSRHPPLPSRM